MVVLRLNIVENWPVASNFISNLPQESKSWRMFCRTSPKRLVIISIALIGAVAMRSKSTCSKVGFAPSEHNRRIIRASSQHHHRTMKIQQDAARIFFVEYEQRSGLNADVIRYQVTRLSFPVLLLLCLKCVPSLRCSVVFCARDDLS